jgi:hypothetical protein
MAAGPLRRPPAQGFVRRLPLKDQQQQDDDGNGNPEKIKQCAF